MSTTQLSIRSDTRVDVAAAAALVVFWSSGFIGARLGTEYAPADTLLAWRYLATMAILLPFVAGRLRRLGRRTIGRQALIGVLTQALYLGGVVTGVGMGVPAGTAALIAALQPLVVANASRRFLGSPVTGRQRLGLWLGLAGVGMVVADDVTAGDVAAWAYLLPLGGMLALSAGTVLDSHWRPAGNLVDSFTIHVVASAALITTEAAMAGRLDVPASTGFWWAVAWVTALSSLGGYGAYLLVLRRSGATAVSGLLYLTPPATMIWSWAMFDDGIGVRSLLGLIGCAVAVWLVLSKAPVRRRPAVVS